jgi:hypothetical protein
MVDMTKKSMPNLAKLLKGVKRRLGMSSARKSPITPEMLLKISKLVKWKDKVERVTWYTLIIGFWSFLRSDNLVPKTLEGTGPILRRNSVTFTEWGLWLKIGKTKTIQMQERSLEIPLVSVKDSPLCPVAAVRWILNNVQAGKKAPLFSFTRRSCVTYRSLVKKLRSWLEKLGLDPLAFGTHSLRRGGATYAAQAGADHLLIKDHGDWKSDAYLVYLSLSLEQKLSLPRAMATRIAFVNY